MELTANIWPVVDSQTGIVLRYFARAYALDCSDDVIAATLSTLAISDFRMARVFRVPNHAVLISEHGEIRGAISIRVFQEQLEMIVEPSLKELEEGYTKLQGITQPIDGGKQGNLAIAPRFGEFPYLVVTTLIEDENGQLSPYPGEPDER